MVVVAVIGDEPRDVEAALLSASGLAAPRCRRALLQSAGPFGGAARVLALTEQAGDSASGHDTDTLLLGVALQQQQQQQQTCTVTGGDTSAADADRRGRQYAARRAALEAALLLFTAADAVLWLVRAPNVCDAAGSQTYGQPHGQKQPLAAVKAAEGVDSENAGPEQAAMAAAVRSIATLQQAKLLLPWGGLTGAAAGTLDSPPPNLQLAVAMRSGNGVGDKGTATPGLPSPWDTAAEEAANVLGRACGDSASSTTPEPATSLFAWGGVRACAPPAAGLGAIADAIVGAASADQAPFVESGRWGFGSDNPTQSREEDLIQQQLPAVGQLLCDLIQQQLQNNEKSTSRSRSQPPCAAEAASRLAAAWSELQALLHSASAAAAAVVQTPTTRRSSDGGGSGRVRARGKERLLPGRRSAQEEQSEDGDSWSSAELSSEGEDDAADTAGNPHQAPSLRAGPVNRHLRGQTAGRQTKAVAAAATGRSPAALPFPAAATAAEVLSLSVDSEWFGSQRLCAAAAHAALRVYLEGLPSLYPEATHVDAAARAAAAYSRTAAGPAAPEYARRLATACRDQWERGRRACGAEALLSRRPCLLAPHTSREASGCAATGSAVPVGTEGTEAGDITMSQIAHDTGVELVVATPDGAEQQRVPEWFDPAAANVEPQLALLKARRQAAGIGADAAASKGVAAGLCPVEGCFIDVYVEPLSSFEGGDERDTGTAAASGAKRRIDLGPWMGCWPQLAANTGSVNRGTSSSSSSNRLLAVYDSEEGLRQPGFMDDKNKLWRLEVRGTLPGGRSDRTIVAAQPIVPAEPLEQQQQQQAAVAEDTSGGGDSSSSGGASAPWLAVMGGGAVRPPPALGADDFPSLQETILAGKGQNVPREVTRAAAAVAPAGGAQEQQLVRGGGGGGHSAVGDEGLAAAQRQAALAQAWAAMGSGAGGGGRHRDLLAALHIGLEYECFDDGRRLIASPGDIFRTAQVTTGPGGPAGGRGRGSSGSTSGGGPGGGGPGRMVFCPCPLVIRLPSSRQPIRSSDGGSGGGTAAGTAAAVANPVGGVFRLTRLWVQTPAAPGIRFSASPAIEVLHDKGLQNGDARGWRFSSAVPCELPAGALCALRLPPVYAAPGAADRSLDGLGEAHVLGPLDVKEGGAFLLPGWLNVASSSVTAAGAER